MDKSDFVAGEVYVETTPTSNGFTAKSGFNGPWVGGKQVTGGVLPEPFGRSWWFDLILPDNTNDGCVQMGWDKQSSTGFALCRSWRNVNMRFVTPQGQTILFEHRPTELDSLTRWDFSNEGAVE